MEEPLCQPHQHGTTTSMNQGKGREGTGEAGGEGEFLVDQGHKLLGSPALGEPAPEPGV